MPSEVDVTKANPPKVLLDIEIGILNRRAIPALSFDDLDIIRTSITVLHTIEYERIITVFGNLRHAIGCHLSMRTIVYVELVARVKQETQREAFVGEGVLKP